MNKETFKTLLAVVISIAVVWIFISMQTGEKNPTNIPPLNEGDEVETIVYKDMIRLSSPLPESTIESPLVITGEARGGWYFEASFPVILTNWDGLIIAEGYATAKGDWMTEEFVPFTATLNFNIPQETLDVSTRSSLILQKSNPSGLPEHDDALEITVFLKTLQSNTHE